MSDPVIIPLDVPEPIAKIKKYAEDFNKFKAEKMLRGEPVVPVGKWWNENQSVEFYHAYFSALQKALNGLEHVMGGRIVPQQLYAEISLMMGQTANIIVDKAPKIELIDK